MPRYYLFATEEDAVAAEARIVANVRTWAEANAPDALSEDKSKLRGRNAATGEFEDHFTERWAIPQQTETGKWVFPVPTQERTTPIPVETFVAGVTADEAEYDSAWFPHEDLA